MIVVGTDGADFIETKLAARRDRILQRDGLVGFQGLPETGHEPLSQVRRENVSDVPAEEFIRRPQQVT